MSATGTIADACAVGAVCVFGASLQTIDIFVQIVAGSLAAIAAAISIGMHIYRWLHRK